MRVRHLIVAAAASIAFAVTPALAKQVLVRGPPEIICEGIPPIAERREGHTIVRTVSCDGRSATIQYMADLDPDRPNKHPFAPSGYWEHTLTVTGGSAELESEIRAPGTGYVYRVLSASVEFTPPPERIPLDRGSGVAEVTARMTCSGKSVHVRDGPHLRIVSPSLSQFTSFARTGARERDPGGFERDVFEAVCSGDEARHEFNVSHSTVEIRIRFSTDTGGTHLIPLGRETELSIRYPYTLVEEPDEPEVAGGIQFPDVDFPHCGAAKAAADVVLGRYDDALSALGELGREVGRLEAEMDYELTVRSRYVDRQERDRLSKRGEETLRAQLTWKGGVWLADVKRTLDRLALFKFPKAIPGFDRLREALDVVGMVTTEVYDMPLDEAVALIKEIHADTLAVIDFFRDEFDTTYCQQVLPQELAFEAIYHKLPDVCFFGDLTDAKQSMERSIVRILLREVSRLGEFHPFDETKPAVAAGIEEWMKAHYNIGVTLRDDLTQWGRGSRPEVSLLRVAGCESRQGDRVPIAEVPLDLPAEARQ